MAETFSAWLTRTLHERAITQERLARTAGYSAQYINDIIRHRRTPPLTTVLAICDALEVDPTYPVMICGHVPPVMHPFTEADVAAWVAFIAYRRSMKPVES